MSADRLSNYLDYKREVEPEFKNDQFEAELLDEQENAYQVKVKYEAYLNCGDLQVVSLEISGSICRYTFEEVKDIIAERNGKKRIFMECKVNYK